LASSNSLTIAGGNGEMGLETKTEHLIGAQMFQLAIGHTLAKVDSKRDETAPFRARGFVSMIIISRYNQGLLK
jgi:hypothetical protein